jgi:DNA-binding CsgD family transcriptional regulator
VRALRAGAVDFLQKPADSRVLLARVGEALARDVARRSERASRDTARKALQELTARERDVLPLILAGHSSKDIARRLAISHRTVEIHRAHIMRKTGSATLVELAAIARATGSFTTAAAARRKRIQSVVLQGCRESPTCGYVRVRAVLSLMASVLRMQECNGLRADFQPLMASLGDVPTCRDWRVRREGARRDS